MLTFIFLYDDFKEKLLLTTFIYETLAEVS